MSHEHFYGKSINRREEKEYIEEILKKYKKESPSDELKEKIYNELMEEKSQGRVTIPFSVTFEQDPLFPPQIKVELDPKV